MDEQTTVSIRPGVVEEYVDNSAGEATDALMADVIAQVQAEWTEDGSEATPEEVAAAPEGEEAPATEETPAEEETGGAEETAEETDRGTERLVQREVELRLKEEGLKTREAKLQSVEQENTQLRTQLAELQAKIPNDFFESLRSAPTETLRQQGYDPDHLVRVVLAEKLMKQGKEVPKELRDEIRAAEYEYKQKQLDQKHADLEQRIAATRFAEKVEGEARQYIKAMSELKPEFSKDAPTVARVAKADPERVFAEIMDEINRDANARRREPGAQLISYAEAARRVEKRFGEMQRLFTGDPKANGTIAAETKSTSAATGASSKTKTAVKPLVKPRAKTNEELEKEGLEAALAEYKRVELAGRPKTAPLRK